MSIRGHVPLQLIRPTEPSATPADGASVRFIASVYRCERISRKSEMVSVSNVILVLTKRDSRVRMCLVKLSNNEKYSCQSLDCDTVRLYGPRKYSLGKLHKFSVDARSSQDWANECSREHDDGSRQYNVSNLNSPTAMRTPMGLCPLFGALNKTDKI